MSVQYLSSNTSIEPNYFKAIAELGGAFNRRSSLNPQTIAIMDKRMGASRRFRYFHRANKPFAYTTSRQEYHAR